MNKLVTVGYLGCKRAYLNVSREEAVRRYCAADGVERLTEVEYVEEFTFDDEFGVYDAWGPR